VSASHQDNGKLLSIYFPKQLLFDVQLPRSPDLNPLGFYLCRHLKTPAHSVPIKDEQIFHQWVFDACQSFDSCPETILLIIKPTSCTNFWNLFLEKLYRFRTGFLSIIRSLVLYTQQ